MKTLAFVGLGAVCVLATMSGCAAAAGVDDRAAPNAALPPEATDGRIAVKTRWQLPDVEVNEGLDPAPITVTPGVVIELTPAGDGSGDGSAAPPAGGGAGESTPPPSSGGGAGESTPAPSDGPGDAPVIGPQIVEGNPTCAERFGDVQTLRIERLKDGTYSTTSFSANVAFAGDTVTYSCSGATLVGVIVKGGPHASVFTTTELDGVGQTPSGEDVSHVDFCYRLD